MNYALLKKLIELAEQYEQPAGQPSGQPTDLAGFSAWLFAQTHPGPYTQAPAFPPATLPQDETPETVISKLVVMLYRYAKTYLKKALEGTALQTADEFTYLTVLLHRPGLTKMELIELNLHEKTSGMEIIKRLLDRKLVHQQGSQADRRSKQLYITELGRTVLLPIFERMHQVSQLVSGDLAGPEKLQLIGLLNKLAAFHHPIFKTEKQTDWPTLVANYLAK
ncbi:MAG: MarR family winged helix-turn-helix transcriptional regulator [Bernardetiaceae bacterium]|jgi:DNA-binding MarR family transcriptional regulator|nr:MarR family winged helix-turn-helix transcriptional regulator [Bernardetiaceae bacterium]